MGSKFKRASVWGEGVGPPPLTRRARRRSWGTDGCGRTTASSWSPTKSSRLLNSSAPSSWAFSTRSDPWPVSTQGLMVITATNFFKASFFLGKPDFWNIFPQLKLAKPQLNSLKSEHSGKQFGKIFSFVQIILNFDLECFFEK